MAVVSALVTK